MNLSYRPNQSLRWLMLAQLCLVLGTSLAKAQTAPAKSPTDAPRAKPVPVETTTSAKPAGADDEAVVLSPFEVTTNNTGYYSANTMSGTRFNTKLDDLASSITIMTKDQMSDFAMLDMNDVFLYVGGTQGTGTYTDYSLDRNGSISDNVSANPTQANRIRGIAPANIALGNIETMGRVPIDPINVASIEISRGPNANVFGLGNPSGTVNQVPTTANLSRNHVEVGGRGDNLGGYRSSLDVNQVLLKDKLAIRASGVFQHDGFELKPSGVDTERYNGMIKYQPFKYTTISGSMFYYHAYGNRPNAIPPRDNLSYWLASGRPTWDPVTQTVHRADGSVVGTYTATTYNGPDYFTSAYLGNNNNQMFIDQSGLAYWAAPQSTTSTVGPVGSFTGAHYLQTSAAAGAVFSGTAPRPFAQYLFNTTPTVSDKSIYDYSSIYISSPNSFWDRTLTSNIQIDQIFINTQMQTLALQAGFMREDSDRWTNTIIGGANDNGQSGQLMVDINERLLDGKPNPFFLRPYIATDKPRTQENPQKWDTSRAQLAYRLDLTEQKNLLKWLGWFQFTGYAEYKYRVNRQYSWRDAMASNPSWIPAGTYTGTQSSPAGTPTNLPITSGEYRYYVGDTNGNNVDYAPGNFKLGVYPFVWGNSATGVFHTDQILLDQVAADKTGGTFDTKTVIRTKGAVMQSHLFTDHLVTTLGVRQDNVITRFGNPGNPTNAFNNADGTTFNYAVTDGWQPLSYANGGRTTNVQFVARPFTDLAFVSNLVNSSNGFAHFMGALINGLSVNYNKSDSFLVSNPAQDLYKNILPNPTGNDKSWGLGANLFDGKLVIRFTRFDTLAKDAQTGDMSTVAGRVLREDFLTTGAGSPTPSFNLYGSAQRWVTWAHPTWTADQVATEVQSETKFSAADANYYINAPSSVLPVAATADVRSVGSEIDINYNPTKFLTFSGSVTDTKTINQNISKALVNWIDDRMPIWTTIVDPSIVTADAIAEGNPNKLWWLHHYVQSGTAPALGTAASYLATSATPQQNYQAFVQAPFGIIRAQEGKSNPQVGRYSFRMASSLQLAGITDNKWFKRMSVGGAVRWEDKAAIGYYGVQSLPAIITDLDPNRPIYDHAHTYVDMFVTYKTKLWHDKVPTKLQFNVRNLGQTSHLQPVGAFPDGSISTYRIVDPALYILSASFEL
jgi:hypothetical protein